MILYGDRDKMINHLISERNKLVQREYKSRHDWASKQIHLELCKKFKFDHLKKWCTCNQKSVPENETHKILWNFEIQTEHLISVRLSDLGIVNDIKRAY